MDMLESLLEPVIVMLGGKYEKGKGSKPRSTAPPSRTFRASEVDESKRESALMSALMRASHQAVDSAGLPTKGSGVSVTTVQVSEDSQSE